MKRPSLSTRLLRVPALALSALLALVAFGHGAPAAAQEDTGTLLLQTPTIAGGHIVFVYADDLWITDREGGPARRLTSSPGSERAPRLSPDGSLVAFSGEYEGNVDVYVLPIEGGMPRRLTWHPGGDTVLGWTPDGKQILFRSGRSSGAPVNALFQVSVDGGTPTEVGLPRVAHAALDAKAERIAYTPYFDAFNSWKRYRGGRVTPIWIFDRQTKEVEVVPRVNASDTYPTWLDGTVYFASDRGGVMNLYRYRPGGGEVEQVTHFDDYDVRSADSGDGVIVFEQGGRIHVYDPRSNEEHALTVQVMADGLAALPRWEEVAGQVRSASVAPNGKRVVFGARGEIITVPRKHGAPRNLSRSPGVNDRSPVWSPDGKELAWFADTSGEYQLVVRDVTSGDQRELGLDGGGFYYAPRWSPDSKNVSFRDKTNRVAYVTLETGKVTTVAREEGSLGVVGTEAVWSPDSKWIAFEHRDPETLYDKIALFEVATGKTTIVTDGFAAAGSPAFSRDGKLLFFTASVDQGPNLFGLNMSSSAARAWEGNLYVAVLRADGENPLAPRSDEGWSSDEEKEANDAKDADKGAGAEPAEEKASKEEPSGQEGGQEKADAEGAGKEEQGSEAAEEEPSIDVEGLDQRILALPVPSGRYSGLETIDGALLFVENPLDGGPRLRKYDLKEREVKTLEEGVQGFSVSADGKTLLLSGPGGTFKLAGTDAGKPDTLAIGKVRVWADPAKEWPEMLREVWRIQRDYFYDPNMHGVDWNAMWTKYARFLPYLAHRDDLSYVIRELIGELVCGHQYVFGGDTPEAPDGPSVGLLGADWGVDSGRFRVNRILHGQNWDPGLHAPLTQPGVDVHEGDYLIAVNGVPVTADQNLYRAFQDTAGKETMLSVSTDPAGGDARDVKVVPIGSEGGLRRLSWVEANRKRVEELSGGKLAYIYMPNTGDEGRAAFDRDFYSQVGKEGVVLDERFNGGGQVADYVIDVLSRHVRSYWLNREGWLGRSPFGLIAGPKVMIINERAGSGGDWMPWAFRNAGLGPLVGTRTWGGLVGISGYPPLMDGGAVTSADFGVMDPEGHWAVENKGVPPDVEVVQWPKDVLAGHDPQLERAVQVALEALAQNPPKEKPTYTPPAAR